MTTGMLSETENAIRSAMLFVVFFVCTIVVIRYINRGSQERAKIKRISAVILVILEIARIIVHVVFGTITLKNIEYMPFTLCGWIVILIAVNESFRPPSLANIIITLGYPSSLLALLIAISDYSVFHFFTLQSLMAHGLIFLFSTFYIVDAVFPTKFLPLNFVLGSIVSISLLLNKLCNTNFIFLSKAPFELPFSLPDSVYSVAMIIVIWGLFNISNHVVNRIIALKPSALSGKNVLHT